MWSGGTDDDCLLEDIICYPPDKGFIATTENSRRSGEPLEKTNVRAASVSKYSPCQGQSGPRPDKLKNDPASDWVLLEIANPSFRHQSSVKALSEGDLPSTQKLQVIGFPGGDIGWKNGDIVRPITVKDFRSHTLPAHGMIDYLGPEETRPGMSGGGIFFDDGSLVGIHRSNTDAVMKRGGIRADAIAKYLKDEYQIQFYQSPSGNRYRKRYPLAVKLVFLTFVVCICFAAFWPWQREPEPVPVLPEGYREQPVIPDPKNTVWYIEARPWVGRRDNPGFAQARPVSMGSGVLVTLALDNSKPKTRTYILTCAHVIRDWKDDLLLEDIICYPPRTGFIKTSGDSRKSGEGIASALPAKVSKYSPCQGKLAPRPYELKSDPASDWALLEINQSPVHQQPSAYALYEGAFSENQLFEVIGFPSGALTWKNGDLVYATSARTLRPRMYSEPGMIDYYGPEETRAGMSGGGLFDKNGFLVGIHRFTTDAVMKRGGIRADTISKHLKKAHNLVFSPPIL
jgi:S1-C subfamily serine protease